MKIKGGKGGKMHHTIKIYCSSKGNFTYDPPPYQVRLKKDDTVEWICEDGNFALNFGWGTPFERGRYPEFPARKAEPKLRSDVRNGRYKYFVAVAIGEKIWTDDPDIIIDP